jgi:hypothetical protein
MCTIGELSSCRVFVTSWLLGCIPCTETSSSRFTEICTTVWSKFFAVLEFSIDIDCNTCRIDAIEDKLWIRNTSWILLSTTRSSDDSEFISIDWSRNWSDWSRNWSDWSRSRSHWSWCWLDWSRLTLCWESHTRSNHTVIIYWGRIWFYRNRIC